LATEPVDSGFLNLVINAEQAIREVRESGPHPNSRGSRLNRVMITIQDERRRNCSRRATKNLRSVLHHQTPGRRHGTDSALHRGFAPNTAAPSKRSRCLRAEAVHRFPSGCDEEGSQNLRLALSESSGAAARSEHLPLWTVAQVEGAFWCSTMKRAVRALLANPWPATIAP